MFEQHELEHLSLPEVLEEFIRLKISNAVYVIRNKCKENNIPCDFTIDDLIPFPLSCPITGHSINYFNKGKGGLDDSPSIDRVEPTKGYVKGNVRIISFKANRMKQDASPKDTMNILAYSMGVNKEDLEKVLSAQLEINFDEVP